MRFFLKIKVFENLKPVHVPVGVVSEYKPNVLTLASSLAIVLARFLMWNSSKKRSSLASLRTRALPSQLPVGIKRMTWAPRCLVTPLQVPG